MCLLLLIGCWDSKELNEIGIVTAIAIDKDPKNGEIILTQQTLNASVLNVAGQGSGPPVKNHESKGKTILDAIRNGTQEFDRKKFFNHNKIIIIHENVAREGVLSILDIFVRDLEGRGLTLLSIARGGNAREILDIEPEGIEKIQASSLEKIMENYQYTMKSSKVNLNGYYMKELEEGINPIVGILQKVDHKVKLMGVAIFKKNKLIGNLNEIETRGYHWVIGEMGNATISIPSLKHEDELVQIEMIGGNSTIKPFLNGDKISFTINSQVEVALAEQQSKKQFDPVENLKYLKQVEEKIKEFIENEMTTAIEKVQKEYQTDIFGFGRQLHKSYPREWGEVKENWDEIFSNSPYTITIDVKIKHTGLIQGSFSSEE